MFKLLFANIFIFYIGPIIFPASDCITSNNVQNKAAKNSQQYVNYLESQPSVITEEREYALFYTIYLSATARYSDIKESVRIVAKLQEHVYAVSPSHDPVDEIVAGVGFGEELYAKIRPELNKRFTYHNRRGKLGNMPATGGDIFIHAKSNSHSKLFELTERISQLIKSTICHATDDYTFQYRINRDMTGFVDGTDNPKGDAKRREVAVIPQTGGSYGLSQRWVHDLNKIASTKPSVLEVFLGRTLPDSIELPDKSKSAHIQKVTGLHTSQLEIVRQSMPYGTVHGEAGLFFIAYAASVANFDFMLDQMVGAQDYIPDDLMRLTKCVTGNYWYFPGVDELKYLI